MFRKFLSGLIVFAFLVWLFRDYLDEWRDSLLGTVGNEAAEMTGQQNDKDWGN